MNDNYLRLAILDTLVVGHALVTWGVERLWQRVVRACRGR